jgi:dihydropteroate synthase
MSKPGGSEQKKVIHGPGFTLTPGRAPLVMGVLNVTPDSFSDGGEHFDAGAAVRHAREMARNGADIIDIGGESSRPGSEGITVDEELRRVIPVIESLADTVTVPLSIDTQHASVAYTALEAGCRIVNDITACKDPEMPDVVTQFGVPIVIMHMKGDPKSMQVKPTYKDVLKEVRAFLAERVDLLKRRGVEDDMIVIDPGIGFGKRFRDNLDLLGAIDYLREPGYPVLIGASRKAFLGELLDADPGDRLSGSLATAAWCHRVGVDIVRVHDVKETVGLFRVLDAIEHPDDYSANW